MTLGEKESEPIPWLWPERIPRSGLTLICGDPGSGKSLIAIDLAARVSRGTPWPDRWNEPNPAGDAVIVSADDDLADTVCPRMVVAGGDCARVMALLGVRETEQSGERAFILQDIDVLRKAIDGARGCRLVVIDPATAFLGGVDSHKNAELRGLLRPLAQLARDRKVAIVLVSCLNEPMAAAVRAAWLVARDRENPARRLFLPLKANLARESTGLAFAIVHSPDNPEVPIISWESEPIEGNAGEDRT